MQNAESQDSGLAPEAQVQSRAEGSGYVETGYRIQDDERFTRVETTRYAVRLSTRLSPLVAYHHSEGHRPGDRKGLDWTRLPSSTPAFLAVTALRCWDLQCGAVRE